MRGLGSAALIATAVALLPVAGAAAQLAGGDVSREQARELAAAAGEDPAALERLRGITRIDGKAADLARALDAPELEQLDSRLRALERSLGTAPAGGADAAAAREGAAEIVAGFDDVEEVGPVAVEDSDGSSAIALDLGSLWLPLLIAAAIAGAFLAYRLVRNREAAGRLAASESGAEVEVARSELERRADEAERAGAFGEALRLRYGIALRQLQEIGRVPGGPAVTASRVSRELGDPRADHLVGTFERVAYGGRGAGADDAREAREGWPRLVEGARGDQRNEAAGGGAEERP